MRENYITCFPAVNIVIRNFNQNFQPSLGNFWLCLKCVHLGLTMLFWDSKATGNLVLALNFLHWQCHVSLMTFGRCKPGSTKVPFCIYIWGFSGSSHGKNLPIVQKTQCDHWVGRIPGEGNGNPLQCSCLENSMDRGTWWATVHGVTKSQTQLSD